MGIPLDLLFFLIQDAKFSFIEMKLWKKAENLSYNTTGPESARSQDDLKPFVFQDKLRETSGWDVFPDPRFFAHT